MDKERGGSNHAWYSTGLFSNAGWGIGGGIAILCLCLGFKSCNRSLDDEIQLSMAKKGSVLHEVDKDDDGIVDDIFYEVNGDRFYSRKDGVNLWKTEYDSLR